VAKAVEPDLIIWENYGISVVGRIVRTLVYIVFFIGVLLFCFYAVVSLEARNQKLEESIPTLNCASFKITERMALDDFKLDVSKRNGMYHCFCKKKEEKEGIFKTMEYKFKLDKDQTHCYDWIYKNYKIAGTALAIACVVGAINVSVELLIGFGSEYFSKPRNHQQIILDSMSGIAVI